MKKTLVIFAVLLLFSHCSSRLKRRPLFAFNDRDVEAIDTAVLRTYINYDSLKKLVNYTYYRGAQTVTVNSMSNFTGGSYNLIIKNGNVENILMVSRNDYHLLSVYRETHNLKTENFVNKYRYYDDGRLAFKSTEQNIQKLVHSKEPRFINAGRYLIFSEQPYQIKTAFDYDKEYTFSLKAVLKMYKNKIDWNSTYLNITKIFFDYPFNPKNPNDVSYKNNWGSKLKFKYPYYRIELTDQKTSLTNGEMIDGKTGAGIFKFSYTLQRVD